MTTAAAPYGGLGLEAAPAGMTRLAGPVTRAGLAVPRFAVTPRETVLMPSVALTVPTCLVTTGEVVTLKFGLTVVPAGMKTLAGTVTPARLVVDRLTVRPPEGAGPVR